MHCGLDLPAWLLKIPSRLIAPLCSHQSHGYNNRFCCRCLTTTLCLFMQAKGLTSWISRWHLAWLVRLCISCLKMSLLLSKQAWAVSSANLRH